MFPSLFGGLFLVAILSVVFAILAFNPHRAPKFKTEAFKAMPPDKQRRAIRTVKIAATLGAVICMGFVFTGAFVLWESGRTNRDDVAALIQQGLSETAAEIAALAKVEASIEHVLAPGRLVTAEGVAEARKWLVNWTNAVNRFEAYRANMTAQAEQNISALTILQSERDVLLASLRSEAAELRPMFAQYIRAKREMQSAFGQKLDLLQARRGPVTVRDGQLTFANSADAQQNAAIDKRIETAGQREEAAIKALDARALATQEKARQGYGK